MAEFQSTIRNFEVLLDSSSSQPISQKLPISTTKRDLDVGAEIYLHARQYCMEGLDVHGIHQ